VVLKVAESTDGAAGSVVDITKIDANKGFFDEFERPSKEQWKEVATAALKGAPFDKVLLTKTYEDLIIEPIYSAEDIEGLPHLNSRPGLQPYVRGTEQTGFLQTPWVIAQEMTNALPEEFNSEACSDLSRGQTGLTIVLDAPTRNGLDPKDAVTAEVGAQGVSLASVADLAAAIKGVDLKKTNIICYTAATALPMVAMLAAATKNDGETLQGVEACVGCDPLTELATEGSIGVSLKTAYDCMFQTLNWSLKNAPKLQTIFIQGHPYHNAGASSTQEVAFALSTAAEYLREMIGRGLSIDQVAPSIRFGFSLGSNFFMEIAKLRAARILWSQLVAAFGGNEESQKMVIHGRTSEANKTVFDPYVNMLRITTEGFSGAVGGVDSMHLAPFDEPIRTPDTFSRRIARNVQIMLQEEARFTMPIDMAGGSYYIEKMTDEFGRAAWALFQEIEKDGGMLAAVKAGRPQAMSADTAAKRAKSIALRQDVILGTNMYANLGEQRLEAPVIDHEELKRVRTAAVADYQAKHAEMSLPEVLSAVGKAVENGQSDGVEAGVAAIAGGATLGDLFSEIAQMDAGREKVAALSIHRSAEAFEELRKTAESNAAQGKSVPIFLANMGPVPQHKPRADFARGFFEVAGFEIIYSEGFETAEAAAAAALQYGSPAIVICSTDATYPDYVPGIVKAVKAAKPEATVIVAGRQKPEVEAEFIAAGVDDFIHVKANSYEINKKLQDKYMGAGRQQ
jgi:methylmalonyl-CoA mutase